MGNKIVMTTIVSFLLILFSSLTRAQITLSVGNGTGFPGAHENRIEVSLDYFSLDVFVRSLSMDICDVNDYVTCTGCEPTGRVDSPCVRCVAVEQTGGCCRVLFFDPYSSDPIVPPGTGPIMNIIYDISVGVPVGECTDLNIENIQIADQFNNPLDATPAPGEICFNSCTTNEDCINTPFCNGEETCNTETGICEDGINPCQSPTNDFCEEFTDQCVPEPTTPVALFIESSSGPPGSQNTIELILYNQDHELKQIEVDICDVDNYLVCTEFAPNCERGIWDFDVYSMELDNGCCQLIVSSSNPESLFPPGIGSIGSFTYDVLENAPLGESRDLNPENARMLDQFNNELAVSSFPGEFCFSSDPDNDGVSDCEDNCPNTPNGTDLGTCVETIGNIVKGTGVTCTGDSDCELDEYCDLNQGDCNENGIGDACECYADANEDGNVFPGDLMILIDDYGQTGCHAAIYPPFCQADFDDDGTVFAGDLMIMIEEYGNTGCPVVQ